MLSYIFNTILYQPLFNLLILLYEYLPGHDFGVAVIVLTLLVKLISYPLGAKAIKTQKTMNDLQPRIQEIQNKYKDDKTEQAQAVMELYKKEKINPFSGFLLLFIQFPILIALYRVFRDVLRPEAMSYLYHFVPKPSVITTTFLGIIDLSHSFIVKVNSQTTYYWPAFVLALLAGITQFWQTKSMVLSQDKKNESKSKQTKKKGEEFSEIMQKQMQYLFPVLTVTILFSIPSAIAFYWTAITIFSIVQQYFIYRKQ